MVGGEGALECEPERAGWDRALAGLALSALRDPTPERLGAEAVTVAARALERDVELWQLEGDDGLVLGAAVGCSAGLLGSTSGELDGCYLAGALAGRGPLTVGDWRGERRCRRPRHLAAAGVLASAAVAVRAVGRPAGVLAVHGREAGPLEPGERRLLGIVATVLGEAWERWHELQGLRRRALEDQLTGLANRAVLYDRLDHALLGAARRGDSVAVLFLDLDGFKDVNDGLGHQTGDELLVAVARRLEAAVRRSDTLTRAGGDEFAVVCEQLRSPDDARDAAERLRQALAEPFQIAGRTLRVTTTIGVSVTGRTDLTAEQLIGEADRAMYKGKQAGGDRVELDLQTRSAQ